MDTQSGSKRIRLAGIFAFSVFSLTFQFHSTASAQVGPIGRPPRNVPAPTAGPPAFLTDAINKAKTPATVEGGWYITAKVSIRTLDGKEKWVAKGVVNAAGDMLSGTIPMTINGSSPEGSGNSLNISIRPTTPVAIGLQWLIAGKPFLGRPAQGFTAVYPPLGDFLSTSGDWNGATRHMDIELTSEFRKPIRFPGKH